MKQTYVFRSSDIAEGMQWVARISVVAVLAVWASNTTICTEPCRMYNQKPFVHKNNIMDIFWSIQVNIFKITNQNTCVLSFKS